MLEVESKPKRGRKIKRKYARTEFLKIRTSKEHKQLLINIRKEVPNSSEADIVEAALAHYGLLYALKPGSNKMASTTPKDENGGAIL